MPELITSEGIRTIDHVPDEQEVVERAEKTWQHTQRILERRRSQRLEWDSGPVCLVFTGDWHLGGDGVNFPRLRRDMELVTTMPNTWLFLLGDVVDNFIVGRLQQVRLKAHFSIQDEWALVTFLLKLIGPQLVASVAGNHDKWTIAMSGIDFFREALDRINPDCLYDKDDSLIRLRVGEREYLMRIRHRWKGSSIYNDTHGIERAAKFDFPFNIGVGAHDHGWGLARQFVTGGDGEKEEAIGIQIGTYKQVDDYGRSIGGIPSQNPSVALIIDETGGLTGYNHLERAKEIMEAEV